MHPNERLAEHYRRMIRDGQLAPGDRLPAVRDMVEEHGVAAGTVRNALSWLRVEGYIVTTQRGSFVAQAPSGAPAPRDLLGRLTRTGGTLGVGETKRVLSAAAVIPPLYVAELFDQDPAEQVVRREYITGVGLTRTALAVDWYPAELADLVPDILSTAPGQATAGQPGTGDDIIRLITAATGRTITHGRDAMHGRAADTREATHLGVPVGAPILAMAYEWSDGDGVICYGERCLPQRLTIGYEYAL
jgi:GntR family transcriptional regulator